MLKDLREVGRPIQIRVPDGVLVSVDDLGQAVDSRVENVSIQCEAMGGSLVVGRHCSSEPVELDLLVGVVMLQDASNALDDLHILVFRRVEIVERSGVVGRSVRESEINGDGKVYFASAKDVLEEGTPCFNVQVGHVELSLGANRIGVLL